MGVNAVVGVFVGANVIVGVDISTFVNVSAVCVGSSVDSFVLQAASEIKTINMRAFFMI